jgi:glycosyltransferase involved in cell wall biosynthesis
MISIISPVYGCRDCLERLVDGLETAFRLHGPIEIVLVCDASPDGSWEEISRLAASRDHLRGILLSRNFGQQVAVSAGLNACSGDVAVVMDCDLQDNPTDAFRLATAITDSTDIVIGVAPFRGSSSPSRKIARSIYLKTLDYLQPQVATVHTNVSFFALSRRAIDAFNSYHERWRHVSGIVLDLGFERCYLEVEHQSSTNKSTYTLARRVSLAFDGFVLNSERFFRHLTLTSLLLGILSSASGFVLLLWRILVADFARGWLSLALLLAIVLSAQFISFGFVTFLVHKVLTETKQRPIFHIKEEIN